MHPTIRAHRSADAGFIVVAVLWILAALATLATIIAVYVINTAIAFTVHDERLQAEALARAAIELSGLSDQPRPAGAADARQLRVPHRQCQRSRRISCRRARASISTPRRRNCCPACSSGSAPPAGQPTAMPTASSPGARRPQPDAPDESSYYRAAGLTYAPRGAPFQHVAELGLVLGIPEVDGRARDALRHGLFRPGRRSTSMDAAPQVLAALPGMDPSRLNAVLAQRAGGRRNAQRAAGHARRRAGARRRARQQGAARDRTHRVRQRAARDNRGRDLHTRQRHRRRTAF